MFSFPAFWLYTTEARSYSLLYLCTCGTIACATWGGDRARLGSLAFASLGAATNYFSAYLFPVAIVMNLVEDRNVYKNRSFLYALGGSVAFIAMLYAAYLPQSLSVTQNGFWIDRPDINKLAFELPIFVFGGLFQALVYLSAAAFAVLVAWKARIPTSFVEIAVCFLAFALFALVLFAFSQFKPIFVPRYTYFLFPFIALCLTSLSSAENASANAFGVPAAVMKATAIAMCLYSLTVEIKSQDSIRALNWSRAAAQSGCVVQSPCLFVLDDPVLPAFNDLQYSAVANFLSHDKASYIAIRPSDIRAALNNSPTASLIYVKSSRPTVNFEALKKEFGLTCANYKTQGLGSEFCTAGKR
jgi:hypothetical protein